MYRQNTMKNAITEAIKWIISQRSCPPGSRCHCSVVMQYSNRHSGTFDPLVDISEPSLQISTNRRILNCTLRITDYFKKLNRNHSMNIGANIFFTYQRVKRQNISKEYSELNNTPKKTRYYLMNIGAHIFLPTRSLRGGRYQRDIENSKVVQKRTTTWQKTKNDERKKTKRTSFIAWTKMLMKMVVSFYSW